MQAAVTKISAPNAMLGCKATAKAAQIADATGQREANNKTDITRITPASLGCQYPAEDGLTRHARAKPRQSTKYKRAQDGQARPKIRSGARLPPVRLSRKVITANIKAAIVTKYRK